MTPESIQALAKEVDINSAKLTLMGKQLTGKLRLEDMSDEELEDISDELEYLKKLPELEGEEKTASITPSDVHQAADAKGVDWDDSKPFMDMSERVTGKRHLDDMSPKQLEDVVAEIEKKAFTDEIEKLGGIRTQEILAALKQVVTTMPQLEHLRAWSRHAALNLGMAESGVAQALGRNKGRPWVGSPADELKDALHSSVFAALPPTHHTAKDMAGMLPFRHRDYYRWGAGRGKNPELMGKASSADPMLDSFTYELEKLGAMAKKARVVAHIAGPSGAGKSTLLDDLRRENPDLVVKDLDDFDSEARARLGWGSVKKRDYTDRMFSELYTSRQSALDDFLEENKSQRVVLGGHHIEGSNVTKIPEGKKILMDTGALRSAWRNVRRSKKGEIQRLSGGSRKPQGKSWKDILFRHGGRPSLYRMGREDIRELRERGYVPMSSGEIHDLLKTAASSFDPMLDSFADELEKQAGFMEMLEDLKGKISATDLGALAATAIFAGVAVADVRRGGFRGRGAWPRAVEEAIALDRRLPKSRVRAIVKRVTPADVPKIEVVTTREQLRSRMEDRLGHVEIKGIGPLSFLPKRETAHLIDEATERLWREVEVTGNAMAAVGEKTSPFIVISPKAAETTVAHEVGHIVDYFRGGPNKASFDRMDAAMFGSAMDRAKAVSSEAVGRVFHPHYSKTILDPERAAWALVQESAERAKTMPAALKTYETGFHHTRAPMAMMAAGTVPAAWGVGRLIRRRGDDEEKTAGAREIVSQAQFDKLRHLVQEGRIDKGAFDGMRLLSPARALLPSRVVKVAAGPTVIGELLRRVGAGRSALKYDVGTGILGERMKKVLMAEYGPSWARILPRKASQGIADVAGKHPELAPMLALPGVPPGGPLVYVAPKLAIRRALGLRERKALELKLLSLAERGNISGLPSRKALTASLLGISAAGGVATGAVGSGIYSHYGNPDTPEAL